MRAQKGALRFSRPIAPITDCARDTIVYREAGIPFTLACGGNGNYEYSQDQNGKLFCVDSDGFVVTTEVAPNESCDKYIYNSAFYDED